MGKREGKPSAQGRRLSLRDQAESQALRSLELFAGRGVVVGLQACRRPKTALQGQWSWLARQCLLGLQSSHVWGGRPGRATLFRAGRTRAEAPWNCRLAFLLGTAPLLSSQCNKGAGWRVVGGTVAASSAPNSYMVTGQPDPASAPAPGEGGGTDFLVRQKEGTLQHQQQQIEVRNGAHQWDSVPPHYTQTHVPLIGGAERQPLLR